MKKLLTHHHRGTSGPAPVVLAWCWRRASGGCRRPSLAPWGAAELLGWGCRWPAVLESCSGSERRGRRSGWRAARSGRRRRCWAGRGWAAGSGRASPGWWRRAGWRAAGLPGRLGGTWRKAAATARVVWGWCSETTRTAWSPIFAGRQSKPRPPHTTWGQRSSSGSWPEGGSMALGAKTGRGCAGCTPEGRRSRHEAPSLLSELKEEDEENE